MEVKPGYKQTEVGVIPEEWEVKSLRDVLSKGRLGGNYKNQDTESEFPLMKMGNIARGHFDLSHVEFISSGLIPETQHRLAYGDVIFNTRNTLDLVGKVGLWRDELPLAYYNSNLMRLEFDSCEISSTEYANYALNTAGAVARLRSLATGTTSVAAIYTRDLLGFAFVVPPKPEQRAIATALSDVDALLSGLDRLIAKKRDLKQAAMQQLLTGQTRLPGFKGEWEVKRLGDVSAISMGQSPDSKYYNRNGDGVPLIQGNADIEDRRSIARVWTTQVTREGHAGDLLLTVRAPVGAVGRISERCCLGRGVCSLKPKEDVDFVFYSLIFAEPRWRLLEQGSTFTSANSTQVAAFSVKLPNNLVEQTAIAAVLTSMDEELALLQQRREKTRALKQAMMQELLTGRTRLI
jgi:type I restriction enzyme, S subunit